jgi:adenylate cyclase
VHSNAAAKHNAATERPDPGGPVISQACVIAAV